MLREATIHSILGLRYHPYRETSPSARQPLPAFDMHCVWNRQRRTSQRLVHEYLVVGLNNRSSIEQK
jgi:hypothetical protein